MLSKSVCYLLVLALAFSGASFGCDSRPASQPSRPGSHAGATYPGSPGPLPPPSTSPGSPTSPGKPDLETEALVLVNKARAAAGLQQLRQNAKLQSMARNYSKAMAWAGVLSHDLGGGFQNRIASSGVKWLGAGENIAEGYTTAQSVFNGWMNSPGHRANILRQTYGLTGMGLYRDGRGTVWWTQEFVHEAPGYLAQPVPDRPQDVLHTPGGIRATPAAKEDESPWEEPASAPVEWVVQPRPGIRNPNPNPWPSPRPIKRIRERYSR
jgi:uncharacterized protein YkwD